jgi:hypothetical protein
MSGAAFLAISAAICAGVFFNGLRFARMTANPWAGKTILGLPLAGSDSPIGEIRIIGRIQMIFAPLFFLFSVALCLGLLGPVDGIEQIQLR